MTTPTVQQIRASQIVKLGQTMSKAFFDDPLMEYMVPDIDKRLKVGNWFMAKAVGYCHKWGEVYADDTLSGGAAWLGPGNTTMTTIRILRAGLWQMPFRIGLSGMSRFNRLDSEAAKIHKKLMPNDHWYLLMLGVDPEKQKSGIGSAAIDVGAAKAQQAGLPVYLETMTQNNVDYYMKRGFEIGDEFDIDGKVHTWAMVRNPS